MPREATALSVATDEAPTRKRPIASGDMPSTRARSASAPSTRRVWSKPRMRSGSHSERMNSATDAIRSRSLEHGRSCAGGAKSEHGGRDHARRASLRGRTHLCGSAHGHKGNRFPQVRGRSGAGGVEDHKPAQ